MASLQQTWVEALSRESGIRRAIILHGEILDVYQSPRNNHSYVPIQSIVCSTLRTRGFDDIILWDSFQGVRNVKPARWEDIQRGMLPNTGNNSQQAYDMGDIDLQDTQQSAQGSTPPNIDDFLPVVHYYLTHKSQSKIAFILDWSQYMFTTNSSLSEEDRRRLLMLSKSMNNAPLAFKDKEEMSAPSNLLVLITTSLGNIPSIFYQGNPCVKDIAVTGPSRSEREAFLDHESSKWNFTDNPMYVKSKFEDFVDATEGFSTRDLIQVARLSQQTDMSPITPEKIINLYRYGEQKSPWEDLSKEKLRTISEKLKERVKGQDFAIDKVKQIIIQAFTGLSGVQHSKRQRMPKGTLFFVGPTGVGKTELAKSLAEFLFGDEESCIRFDMSEFNHEHSDQRLVGAPPGYVGYEEGGQLTNAVKKRPFSVLLFDEIEKAHQKILDKFLQILEDGRLTDGKGDTVSFAETVIIFTSNIGAAEVQYEDADRNLIDEDDIRREFINKVQQHFTNELKRPELLNRIGHNIVPFNFIINDDFLFAIAKSKIKPVQEKLKEKYEIKDLVFVDERKALSSILSSHNKSMGGRGVQSELGQKLTVPLSMFLFYYDGDTKGKRLIISQEGDKPEFTFHLE
ncbi:MAG: AAA family ATPase [Thermoguttaceae bacterium]|nr:AAA family ATPase [Thermoguttaceae bacterium]